MIKYIKHILGYEPKQRVVDWGDTDTRLADAMRAVDVEAGLSPDHLVGIDPDANFVDNYAHKYVNANESHLDKAKRTMGEALDKSGAQLDAQRAKVTAEIKLLLEMTITHDAYVNAVATLDDSELADPAAKLDEYIKNVSAAK